MVFDVAPRATSATACTTGCTCTRPTRRGRDAADDRIVELVAARGTAVEVVTSDRGLAARVRGADVVVTGAGTFLARLEEHGC